LNETLEQRVAKRTAELAESRARLRRAADLAKLTYFDLDYDRDDVKTAENFQRIMGFALPARGEGKEMISGVHELLRERVIRADRAQFIAETEKIEGEQVRKFEYRVLADSGEERWIESEWHTEIGTDGMPVRVFAANLDVTERKQAEENKKLLMAEVNHRSKNLLAVVQAIVHQTARGADPATFAINLADRLQGLSASQDLLIKTDWHGVDMRELVHAQLSPFHDLIGVRILIEGPSARLTAAAAQAIGMALHELATNAAKHGALSESEGQVRIRWEISGGSEPLLTLQWIEDGGVRVTAPTRKGFGYLVVGSIAEAALEGKVEMDFLETGLTWKLSAPFPDASRKA
jgi:PAS domain S-box-containing protein